MEKLNEILDSIRERFSSPLIFSFLISWLIVNWQIPIAVVFYESSAPFGIPEDLLQYITAYSDGYRLLLWPTLLSLAYTFLSPIVRNIVSAFYTWTASWGNTWNLSISKESKVSMEKYFALRENYKKRTEVLEETISSESITQSKLEETKTSLLAALNEVNKLNGELASVRSFKDRLSNVDVLNGRWERRVESESESLNIDVSGGTIWVLVGVVREQRFQVNSFTYNSDNRSIRFMLMTAEGRFYSYEDLEFRNSEMVGWEYKSGSRLQVVYKRQ